MAKVIFITGGQRSGKSSFAQKCALEMSGSPFYLATSRVMDDDFRQRVDRHKADRDERWTSVEKDKKISEVVFPENAVVVLDCITLWLTNFFMDNGQDVEKSLIEARQEWDVFIKKEISILVVTNELGMSLHANSETGRKFTDLQGWMNQYIAKRANEAYLMVSGISVKISG